MIAKTLFLAKTYYRQEMKFFRDHESQPDEYPCGYLYEGVPLFRASRDSPCPALRAGATPPRPARYSASARTLQS
jgi:hypothetical protein